MTEFPITVRNETNRRLGLLPLAPESGVERFMIVDIDDIIPIKRVGGNIAEDDNGSVAVEADLEFSAGRKVE